jgi:hypothetical protein
MVEVEAPAMRPAVAAQAPVYIEQSAWGKYNRSAVRVEGKGARATADKGEFIVLGRWGVSPFPCTLVSHTNQSREARSCLLVKLSCHISLSLSLSLSLTHTHTHAHADCFVLLHTEQTSEEQTGAPLGGAAEEKAAWHAAQHRHSRGSR